MNFNYLRRLKCYLVTFYLYIKSFFNPPENVTDETIKLLDQLDWFSFVFLSSRRGFSQKLDQPISFRTQFAHNLFRITYCIVLLRIVSLIFIKNHFYRMIAGDLNIENHDYVLFFLALWLAILLVLREYVLHLEERGVFIVLKKYIRMQINGFSADTLNSSESRVRTYKVRFYFVLRIYFVFIIVALTVIPAIIVMVRITDPATFSTLSWIISSFFWGTMEILSICTVACALSTNGISLIIIILTNYFQLSSLNRLCSSCAKHGGHLNRDFMMKTLTHRAIKFSNEFIELNNDLKYCTLLFMIFCSFLADLFMILSLIIPVISDSFSYYLTTSGVITIINVAVIMFLAADFHSMVNSINNQRTNDIQ
ncbi:uncharacterized protein LOC128397767 [Panonychus citri]|uniref:uncharacterized protein LOC128397767 n=1 Tax=Panonychus citri TaxID=50023 RepID=UPI002306F50A|nr:uncharacterized protein LOC128397767 [Panonychus citri]